MSRFDAWVQKLPGPIYAKAFAFSAVTCAVLAYPVFKGRNVRQGHDYLSSERPEAITAGQERMRREERLKRNEGE